MPVLSNPRWEAFVQAWTEGLPAYKAYLDAGYKCTVAAAMTKSSVLVRKGEIIARRRELAEALTEKLVVSRETLAAEYDQIAQAAFADGQYAAAKSAVEAKQNVLGLDPATKSLNLNVSATFNQHSDEELTFELASMISEVRAAVGKAPLALPDKKDDGKVN